MNWLHTLLLVCHMLFAAGIIGLVLLQRGKGADAGAGFGAGASGTVFGARGSASFLSRSTAVLAALFFMTSLSLAYLGGRPTAASSVMDAIPAAKTELPVVAPATTSEAQPRQAEPEQTRTRQAEVPATAPAVTSTSVATPVEAPSK